MHPGPWKTQFVLYFAVYTIKKQDHKTQFKPLYMVFTVKQYFTHDTIKSDKGGSGGITPYIIKLGTSCT